MSGQRRDQLEGHAYLDSEQAKCEIQIASLPGPDIRARVSIAVKDGGAVRTHIGVDGEHGLAPGKASRG